MYTDNLHIHFHHVFLDLPCALSLTLIVSKCVNRTSICLVWRRCTKMYRVCIWCSGPDSEHDCLSLSYVSGHIVGRVLAGPPLGTIHMSNHTLGMVGSC